jgi:hypothetical protein
MFSFFFSNTSRRLFVSLALATAASFAGTAFSAELFDKLDADPWRALIDEAVAKVVVVLERHDIDAVAIAKIRGQDGLPPLVVASALKRRLRDGLAARGRFDEQATANLDVVASPLTHYADEDTATDEPPEQNDSDTARFVTGLNLEVSLAPANGGPLVNLDGDYLVPQADQDSADEATVLGKDGVRKRPFAVKDRRFAIQAHRPDMALAAWGGLSALPDGDADGELMLQFGEKSMSPDALTILQGHAVSVDGSPISLGLGDANGNPLPVELLDGLPTVVLPPDMPFTVLVGNGDRAPIGAMILLDGLDSRYFAEKANSNRRAMIVIGTSDPLKPRVAVLRGWIRDHGELRPFGGSTDDTLSSCGCVTLVATDTKPQSYYQRHLVRSEQTRRLRREGGGTTEISSTITRAHPVGLDEDWSADHIAKAAADGGVQRIANQQVLAVLTIRYRREGAAPTTHGGSP